MALKCFAEPLGACLMRSQVRQSLVFSHIECQASPRCFNLYAFYSQGREAHLISIYCLW